MRENTKVEKVCSFYVSNMHFATMILPWTNKQLEKKIKIITFFENNFTTNIEIVLSKLILTEERKKELLNINWKDKNNKLINIEKIIKNELRKNKENIIIVNGNVEYIDEINNIIEKTMEKYSKKINQKDIKIINFYKVENFNDNIKEILDKHDLIFNTSGEHKIEEIFEGYSREEKIKA